MTYLELKEKLLDTKNIVFIQESIQEHKEDLRISQRDEILDCIDDYENIGKEIKDIFKRIEAFNFEKLKGNIIENKKTLLDLLIRLHLSNQMEEILSEAINSKSLDTFSSENIIQLRKNYNSLNAYKTLNFRLKNKGIKPINNELINHTINEIPNLISFIEKEPNKFTEENKHEHIFSYNGFVLFEYIERNHISKEKGRYEDISFYFRKMKESKFIHSNITEFIEWFSLEYNDDIGKVKTLEQTSNPSILKHYSTSLDWFYNYKK